MTMDDTGYGFEEHEVAAVLDAIVGERDGEDPSSWYAYLSSRQTLLAEVVGRIADQRALAAREIYRNLGESGQKRSYDRLATALNISRSRAQQHVERARELDSNHNSST